MMNQRTLKTILSLVKPFIPDVKEAIVPSVKELALDMIAHYKPLLQEGEESANVIIQIQRNENQEDEPYFMVCSMDSDNKVVRCFEALTTEDLIKRGEQLAKQNNIL